MQSMKALVVSKNLVSINDCRSTGSHWSSSERISTVASVYQFNYPLSEILIYNNPHF